MDDIILIVGANGNLGGRIARAMHAKGMNLRLGVREPFKAGSDLHAIGEIVRVDLDDDASLRAACKGVKAVVSAVQGGPDIIVEGQGRLLDAAQAAGVARFVPSDFSLDLFALAPGENWNSDWRRTFDERLIASGLGYTILLNGGFMEVMLSPFINLIDRDAGTLSFWGEGTQPIDVTSMDDTAAFLAAIVADPTALNRIVRVAGDQVTMPEIASAYEAATGQKLVLRSRGTIDEGYAQLDALKAKGADVMRMLPLMYQLPMMSGKAKLNPVDNDAYPHVRPTGLVEFIKKQGRAA